MTHPFPLPLQPLVSHPPVLSERSLFSQMHSLSASNVSPPLAPIHASFITLSPEGLSQATRGCNVYLLPPVTSGNSCVTGVKNRDFPLGLSDASHQAHDRGYISPLLDPY